MKAIEIERKFLVRDDSWRACADKPCVLQQAYLGSDQNSIRVRLIDGRSARLTIKFRSPGLAREEFEYEIPVEEARDLLLHAGQVIEKTRYRVLHDGRSWEVDVFAGAYQGLTLAEIEMASEDDRFILPHWLGREVTGEKRYSNRAMAAAPRTKPAVQGTAGWGLNPLPQSSLHPD
ncbi:CYTH domain-containing protein [Rhizobium lentis]|uniref:CYTH domain-containing protein n=1 Tax=Rhizobium lentis TaxID=1138194 RepID=UPI001C83DECC|nr:CYTH domain-containing protein [Rhizobium lentis]MBX5039096.1 CYTH domain-containing protein [Rhizobium lentis]MBX5056437.1 CYTH domain-containing protein [Rhizobium lentis]MBX5069950.1 CYTH domain-containing protein [Rhizobium lentis]MBX5111352.1 CYTH domain-containing protein [Rhizobium lentis]MBX5114358.1 CYTH domain-containing protein [Rhizobium lentis]